MTQYLDGITFKDIREHEDFIMKRFPESEAGVEERARYFTSEFKRLYSEPTGRRTLHIICSHGTPIRKFSQQHGGKVKKIKYCGCSVLSVKPKGNGEAKFKLRVNCRHKHLDKKEDILKYQPQRAAEIQKSSNCVLF